MCRIRSALLFIFAFSAISLVPIDAAVANDISNFTTVTGTDVVHAGFGGMRNNGMGTLTVSGVSGTVERALLYWHGPTNSTNPAANSAVTFADSPVTGTNIGFSHDNNWGFANSQAYRSDVTSLVTGNGTYSLAGFVKDSGNTNVNGASLIVFFDDGNTDNDRDVVLFDGNDSNITNTFDSDGWNVTLPGINYESGSGSAFITMHVSDGQTFDDDALILNEGTPNEQTLVAAGPIFQGNSVPAGAFNDNGQLWDIRTENVTSALEASPNTLTLTTGVNADALSLVVAAIDLPAGAAPPTTHTLTVTHSGSGGGTVTDGEGGQIFCTGGDSEFDDCEGEYEDGTTVQLFETPNEGSTFVGWTGCDAVVEGVCSVTMTGDRTVGAQFDAIGEEQADLAIDPITGKADDPDPVSPGAIVRYTVTVDNLGPDDATGVEVTDTISAGSVVGAAGTGWSCSFEGSTATCTGGSIPSGATAEPIQVDVQAPSTGGSITDTATITAADQSDPNETNNSAAETTTVRAAATNDAAATFCLDGCTLTTDPNGSGATPGDQTVTTLIVPDDADPQTVSIVEVPASNAPTFCGNKMCNGQIVTITGEDTDGGISGVTDPEDPIIVQLVFDKTVKGGTQIYIQKGLAAPKLVANCATPGVATPHPCVSTKIILPSGDREITVLLLSGDPSMGKR